MAKTATRTRPLQCHLSLPDRFNRQYHYDWTFLNDQPFDDQFKTHVSAICSGKVQFGLVPEKHWGKDMPSWIDKQKALKLINEMGQKPIPYGGSVPYVGAPFFPLLSPSRMLF